MPPAVIPVPTLRGGHFVKLQLTDQIITGDLEIVTAVGVVLRKEGGVIGKMQFYPFASIVEMEF